MLDSIITHIYSNDNNTPISVVVVTSVYIHTSIWGYNDMNVIWYQYIGSTGEWQGHQSLSLLVGNQYNTTITIVPL